MAEPTVRWDLTQAFEEGDPILFKGEKVGEVLKVEQKGGSTLITASIDPHAAKKMGIPSPGIGAYSVAD